MEKRPSGPTLQDPSSTGPEGKNLYLDMDGNTVPLEGYRGKKILLSFWATWCRPCVAEMPSMMRSLPILEAEGYVLLLPSDQSLEQIRSFQIRTGFDLAFVRYTGSLAQLNIYALPTTFILDQKGEKIGEITGAMVWDSEELLQKLNAFQ
ncbi:MAG: TlpA disulfide reductase family protein [Sediminicola sp.]